jgi:membrane protease YdiL (CAAX protease family)
MNDQLPKRRVRWWFVAAMAVGFFVAWMAIARPVLHLSNLAAAVLAIAFAAVCIWLTVRFVNWRKRRAKSIVASLVVILVVGYVPSAGLCVAFKAFREALRRLTVIDLDNEYYGTYWPIEHAMRRTRAYRIPIPEFLGRSADIGYDLGVALKR